MLVLTIRPQRVPGSSPGPHLTLNGKPPFEADSRAVVWSALEIDSRVHTTLNKPHQGGKRSRVHFECTLDDCDDLSGMCELADDVSRCVVCVNQAVGTTIDTVLHDNHLHVWMSDAERLCVLQHLYR